MILFIIFLGKIVHIYVFVPLIFEFHLDSGLGKTLPILDAPRVAKIVRKFVSSMNRWKMSSKLVDIVLIEHCGGCFDVEESEELEGGEHSHECIIAICNIVFDSVLFVEGG